MAQQTVQRLLCKHLVTLRWALALGLVEEVDVSADDFVDALAGKDLVQDVTERSAFSRAVAVGISRRTAANPKLSHALLICIDSYLFYSLPCM